MARFVNPQPRLFSVGRTIAETTIDRLWTLDYATADY